MNTGPPPDVMRRFARRWRQRARRRVQGNLPRLEIRHEVNHHRPVGTLYRYVRLAVIALGVSGAVFTAVIMSIAAFLEHCKD